MVLDKNCSSETSSRMLALGLSAIVIGVIPPLVDSPPFGGVRPAVIGAGPPVAGRALMAPNRHGASGGAFACGEDVGCRGADGGCRGVVGGFLGGGNGLKSGFVEEITKASNRDVDPLSIDELEDPTIFIICGRGRTFVASGVVFVGWEGNASPCDGFIAVDMAGQVMWQTFSVASPQAGGTGNLVVSAINQQGSRNFTFNNLSTIGRKQKSSSVGQRNIDPLSCGVASSRISDRT